MAFPKTLLKSAANAFLVIAKGDSANEGGFVLTEDQLNAIEKSLTENESAIAGHLATIQSLNEKLTAATTAKDTAEASEQAAKDSLATMTTDRDSWKEKAEEYGAKTDDPKHTGKKADSFSGSDTKAKNSFDQYAEDMGVPRF